jgi:hypothetical protein
VTVCNSGPFAFQLLEVKVEFFVALSFPLSTSIPSPFFIPQTL